MTTHLPLIASALHTGKPLFGSLWLALCAVSAAIAGLIAVVAAWGRWLAATHPAEPAKIVPAAVARIAPATAELTVAAPTVAGDVPPEIVPVIVAAIAATLGPRARVAAIHTPRIPVLPSPSLEALMQRWSYEGRREIYSSHRVR